MNYSGLAVAISVLVAGCATPNPVNSVPVVSRIIDYTAVKPTNVKAKAERFVATVIQPLLKDPSSMELTVTDKVEIKECSNIYDKTFKVWAQWGGINAKNSFGGYTGTKPYLFYYIDGEIASYADGILLGTEYDKSLACALGY